MKSILACSLVALSSMAFVGCASSSQEGVKSDYRTQWTQVNADTMATTDAAKAVLSDRGLKNVSGTSTKVDGTAMGKKSDGTGVKVAIEKGDKMNTSQVSVTVGTIGDPSLGAEIAKAIKDRAEGMSGSNMNDMNGTTHHNTDGTMNHSSMDGSSTNGTSGSSSGSSSSSSSHNGM